LESNTDGCTGSVSDVVFDGRGSDLFPAELDRVSASTAAEFSGDRDANPQFIASGHHGLCHAGDDSDFSSATVRDAGYFHCACFGIRIRICGCFGCSSGRSGGGYAGHGSGLHRPQSDC
jgi:hypothetical protein